MAPDYIKNWFSNFLPFDYPLVYQGITFITNENFYQAMKLPKDEVNLRKEIAYMTAWKAKKAIRDTKKYLWRLDWNDQLALEVMEFGLRWKFASDTLYWYPRLLSTTGEIVEINNWHDNKWGNCICLKCSKIEGKNWLGKILMRIREEHKE